MVIRPIERGVLSERAPGPSNPAGRSTSRWKSSPAKYQRRSRCSGPPTWVLSCHHVSRRRGVAVETLLSSQDGRTIHQCGHAEDLIGARPQICIRRYARELARIDIRSRGRHTQAPGPQIGHFNPRSLRSGFRDIDAIDEQRVAVDRATEPRTSRDSGREIDEVRNHTMSAEVGLATYPTP